MMLKVGLQLWHSTMKLLHGAKRCWLAPNYRGLNNCVTNHRGAPAPAPTGGGGLFAPARATCCWSVSGLRELKKKGWILALFCCLRAPCCLAHTTMLCCSQPTTLDCAALWPWSTWHSPGRAPKDLGTAPQCSLLGSNCLTSFWQSSLHLPPSRLVWDWIWSRI